MDLLKKTGTHSDNRRNDNADKKQLFPKEKHPHTASYHKEQWAFISDTGLRENIAYQMQYLEFLINLYNDYQLYLTLESLLCKDILATVGGVVEAALFDMLQDAKTKAGMPMGTRTDFTALLGEAYHSFNFIDKDMWHYFHELRKVRNYVHLKAADFQEHTAYTVEEANEAIKKLEQFRQQFV
ncbi:MAG TPA: hypothetical protein VHD31_01475 [Candidatus Paceibacterota bacterium]|nr:hypothetical protein [Candidatus Paceibacterota bacterium]